ncbi:MAG: YbaB/EbfC family nucleoid-associated protein [Candidatus Binataceae bacterium]|jgi:DNA-binding YbaB/EbfC family protein
MAQLDLSALLQQAQNLQEKLKEAQEGLALRTVEGDSGGGMVQVTIDGSLQVRRIEIESSLIAANDKAMLEDLIAAAVNNGLRRAQEMVAQEMGKLSPLGGLKLPGMFGGSE